MGTEKRDRKREDEARRKTEANTLAVVEGEDSRAVRCGRDASGGEASRRDVGLCLRAAQSFYRACGIAAEGAASAMLWQTIRLV